MHNTLEVFDDGENLHRGGNEACGIEPLERIKRGIRAGLRVDVRDEGGKPVVVLDDGENVRRIPLVV